MTDFVYTAKNLTYIEHIVDSSIFVAVGTSYEIPASTFPKGFRILGMTVIKDSVFDTGSFGVGTGTGSTVRENIATATEVNASSHHTTTALAWMQEINAAISGGSTIRIFVRFVGGAPPSTGRVRLVFWGYFVAPRSAF